MDTGDAATWFAAGVAIIAAVVAMSNANSAKTQAGAALKQAFEAKKAREAAEAQVAEAQKAATAAEQQVEIMRQTLAAENADRHERSGPQFTIAEGRRRRGMGRIIGVTMLSGPAVVWVRPSWTNDDSVHETDGNDVGALQSGDYAIQRMVTNRSFDIEVSLPKITKPVEIEVYLHCTDGADENRIWERTYSVTLNPPPSVKIIT
ncbi:hypothetical protein PV646_02885 [Streptomyces sp. ID05-26A]|nr:hypothetical protein [Streptomyces sp. ID05-26A]